MLRSKLFKVGKFLDPVNLGQSSSGIFLAAAMILLWFGLSRSDAALALQGASESDYYSVSWNYDLENGIGVIRLEAKSSNPDFLDEVAVFLTSFRFITEGVPLDMPEVEEPPFKLFEEEVVGVGSTGLPLYQYDLGEDSNPANTKIELFNRIRPDGGGPVDITFGFPTAGIKLLESEVYCEGVGATSAIGAFTISENLDFVSVQAIPEPGSIGFLGLGAAAAINRIRRKD